MALQIKSIKNKNSECEPAMETLSSKLLTSAALVISFGVTNPNFDQEINLIGDSLGNEQETLKAEMFKGTFLHNIIGKGRNGESENTRNGAGNTEEEMKDELKELYKQLDSIQEKCNKLPKEIQNHEAKERKLAEEAKEVDEEIMRKTKEKEMIMKEIAYLSSSHYDKKFIKGQLTRRTREASDINTEIKKLQWEMGCKLSWHKRRTIRSEEKLKVEAVKIAKQIDVVEAKLKAYQAQSVSGIKKVF